MKKNIKFIVSIIVLAFTLVLMSTIVNAGTVETLKVLEENGNVTVSGTTAATVKAVAITVYNEDGTTLVTMVTTSVNDDNTYSEKITLAKGTYLVKVADYEGGTFVSEKVIVGEDNTEKTENTSAVVTENNVVEDINTTAKSSNPKTGDIIAIFITVFVISTIGFVITKKMKKS